MTPVEETTLRQQLAATPSLSSFVMANAGSGKTRVLTNRVARLLLDDVKPDHILCITYTKAAAAEMSARLFDTLGEWALLPDEQLQRALDKLEGPDAHPRSPAELSKARQLFARALETPGGLKIQTIHAFCESVLRRFPAEAGFAPGFSVLDDENAESLFSKAIDQMIADAANDNNFRAHFAHFARLMPESDLRALLLKKSGAVAQRVRHCGGIEKYHAAMAAAFGVSADATAVEVIEDFLSRIDVEDIKRARAVMAESGGDPTKFARQIDVFLSTPDPAEKWKALSAILLKANRTPREKGLANGKTDKIDPWVRGYLTDLQEPCVAAEAKLTSIATLNDTMAFTAVATRCFDHYEKLKARTNAADFDDLIASTIELLESVSSAWVSYKLDQGVDHVLVDEAQDTSPEQWRVITALIDDYLSGASVEGRRRSMFAVGDIKQSIYSFQGADAASFQAIQHELGKRLAARDRFENLPLNVSFRTTAPVLRFVDALFDDRAAMAGLGDDQIKHDVERVGDAGLVELWPLTPRREKSDPDPWDAPLDAAPLDSPADRLAEKIAATVRKWLDDGELLKSQGRPIVPGDVMILVQSRSRLFRSVIRALATAGVPTAGADRLDLIADPAIEDIVSYLRAVLTPNDDLSLAEILKSPFFGFSDDQLFDLAHPRETSTSLWRAMKRQADQAPPLQRAIDEINEARLVAIHQGPYAFLQHILEASDPPGKRRIFERLTRSSQDALEEILRIALEFENANPRSTRRFLHWFEYGQNDIKREFENSENAVRVMTAHGAKGLEANIVFLLDAHRTPPPKNVGPLFSLQLSGESGDAFSEGIVFAASSKSDCALSATLRDDAKSDQFEEYRRLLYVAATRARDRLYVCGVESGNSKTDPAEKPVAVQSWHALAMNAFQALRDAVESNDEPLWPETDRPILRLQTPQTAPVKRKDTDTTRVEIAPPEWLRSPAATETMSRRRAPSSLIGEGDEDHFTPAAPAYSPVSKVDPYFRGRTIHRLLELLPAVAIEERESAASAILNNLAPDIDLETRENWKRETLAVLNEAGFADVFSAGSQAEVSVAGWLPNGDRIFGEIDRLIITEQKISIVDYKTNRPPPDNVEDVDLAYLAQLAAYRYLLQEIYPQREISCALLWTFAPRLTPIPAGFLDHAFARFERRS